MSQIPDPTEATAVGLARIQERMDAAHARYERHEVDDERRFGSIDAKLDALMVELKGQTAHADAKFEALTTRFWLLAIGVVVLGTAAGGVTAEVTRAVIGH